MRVLGATLLVLAAFAVSGPPAAAQVPDRPATEPAKDPPQGQQPDDKRPVRHARTKQEFRIGSLTVSSSIANQAIPEGVTNFRDPTYLGTTKFLTAGTDLSWLRSSSASYMNVLYSPQYAMGSGGGSIHDFNQSLVGSISRHSEGSRWRVSLSGNGQIMSFDEALFSTPPLTAVAAASDSTIGDVASALLTGDSADPALAGADGYKPDPALERVYYGRRSAFVGASAAVSYSLSSRMTVATTVGTMQTKHVGDVTDIPGLSYPEVTAQSGSLNLDYFIARRTEIGAGADITQSKSTVLDNTGISARFFVSHNMRRVFFQASVGGGSTSAAAGSPSTITYSGGGGFRFGSHSLVLGTYRDITDSTIIALGRTSSYFTAANVAWYFAPKRSPWELNASFNHLRDAPPGQPPPNTWDVKGAVTRQIGAQFAVHAEVGIGRMGSRRYIQDGVQYQMRQNAVRMSISWSPTAKPLRRNAGPR